MKRAVNISEKRRNLRQPAASIVKVSDLGSGRWIGTLVNISIDGILVLSRSPLELDTEFEISLDSSEADNGIQGVQLSARSIWSDTAPDDPGRHWTGFCITDISASNRIRIEEFINMVI